jgi:hypothetical protein
MSTDPVARLRAADPLRNELPPPLERMPQPRRAPSPAGGRTVLVAANLVLLAAVLLHGVDHALIQERGVGALTFEVFLGGLAITAAAALSLLVSLRGDRRARTIALVVGPWVAALVVVGHFVPHWSEFSDPYADADLAAISYALALATVAAGIALGVAAAFSRPWAPPRPPRSG